MEPPPLTGPSVESQTVTQCLTYLREKDDTARFVGLAMLASILKNVKDRTIIRHCWDAINLKFLDRLLKAHSGRKNPPEQAKDMTDLAIHVIHAFSLLLPAPAENSSLVGRAPGLIAALKHCSEETGNIVIETILVFATGEKGSQAILAGDIKPLLHAAPRYDHALQAILLTLVNGMKSEMGDMIVSRAIPDVLEDFSQALSTATDRPRDRLQLLSFFSELLSRLPSPLLPPNSDWVSTIYSSIRNIITTPHNETERSCVTNICASLLHNYPPSLLFQHPASTPSVGSKHFTSFFLRLLLIDIHSTIPSLLENLSSPTYPTIAQRLASDFDVVAAFIGYLVMQDSLESISIDPNTLLKLRGEIGETFSLTNGFLRDRWDAAYAGTAGYEMDISDDGTSKRRKPDEPLNLTWDTKAIEGGTIRDPLVISAVRALSLWLREDDSLRKEASGLMDLFLGLWKQSIEVSHHSSALIPGGVVGVDYRLWLIGALEGTLCEKRGREEFQKQGGWEYIWSDIKKAYSSSSSPHSSTSSPFPPRPPSPPSFEQEESLKLAAEELRLLLDYVHASSFMKIPFLDDKIREVVRTARVSGKPGVWVGLDVGMLRLAVGLLQKLPGDSRLRRGEESEKVIGLGRELKRIVEMMKGPRRDEEKVDEQEEVVYQLAELMEELKFV